MRVLHFCWTFSALSETFVYEQVAALESRGIESHVLCITRRNERERPFANARALADVASLLPKANPARVAAKLRSAIRGRNGNDSYRQYLIRQLLKELRPDVVHAHFGPAGVLIAPAAARHCVPLLVSFHGYDASSLLLDPEWTKAYAGLFRRAAGISTVSHLMAERLVGINAAHDRVRVVRVGKRLGEFSFRVPEGPVRDWISVGRMTEKKGHVDCIQAFDRLAEQVPAARLQIVGEGEMLDEVRRAAASAKHGDRIKVLGALSHDETLRLMRAADAFVLCSKTAASGDEEGVPTVLMEAQALGLPCVATRHAGIPECIPDENQWLLAPEGDVTALAQRMQALTESSMEQMAAMARAGRARIENEFDIDREAEKVHAWYAELAPSAR